MFNILYSLLETSAETSANQGGFAGFIARYGLLIVIAVLFIGMIWFSSRQRKKQEKEMNDKLSSLKIGDKIAFLIAGAVSKSISATHKIPRNVRRIFVLHKVEHFVHKLFRFTHRQTADPHTVFRIRNGFAQGNFTQVAEQIALNYGEQRLIFVFVMIITSVQPGKRAFHRL